MKRSVTAVILAGGNNSRYNDEKSLIRFNNKSILQHQIELLSSIFDDILIVSDKKELKDLFYKMNFVKDEFENCGPLGGIHVALKESNSDAIFVFACDMPLIRRSLIMDQLSLFWEDPYTNAIIPRHFQGFEPLHSIYAKSCLPLIENQLVNADFSIHNFYKYINKTWYHVSEDNIHAFFNINTHHDYLSLKAKISS